MPDKSASVASSQPEGSFDLTPEGLVAKTKEIEPSWNSLPLESARSVVETIELLDGYKDDGSRTEAGPIEQQVEALRRAAEKRLAKIERGELTFVKADLIESDDVETSLRVRRLRQLLDWFGEADSQTIAMLDFGEDGFGHREKSWHGKVRMVAPHLAYWRPQRGNIPISPRASFVRLLHALLIASGEDGGPSLCTIQAVFKFLQRNQNLLALH
jgi:hypothetical protein